MKDNLKKAFKEVLAPLKGDTDNEKINGIWDESTASFSGEGYSNGALNILDPVKTEQKPITANTAKPNHGSQLSTINTDIAESNQSTVITKDTIIQGTITTESNLIIAGVINGDIESKNNIMITGRVIGDISCNSAEIVKAEIEGNLNVEDKLKIQSDSRITGDLSADSINIAGDVKGNITAVSSVQLSGNACVFGNITTSSISIENGAVLQGNVNIIQEKD